MSVAGSSSLMLKVLKVWLHTELEQTHKDQGIQLLGHGILYKHPGHEYWTAPSPTFLIKQSYFMCLSCSSSPQVPSSTMGPKLPGLNSSWGDVTGSGTTQEITQCFRGWKGAGVLVGVEYSSPQNPLKADGALKGIYHNAEISSYDSAPGRFPCTKLIMHR